jgi:hypothetical protein
MSDGGGVIRWQGRIPAAPREDSGDADRAFRRRWDDKVQVQTVSAPHVGVEVVIMNVSRDFGGLSGERANRRVVLGRIQAEGWTCGCCQEIVDRCKGSPGLIKASEIGEALLMERRRVSDAVGGYCQGPIPWAGGGPSSHDS